MSDKSIEANDRLNQAFNSGSVLDADLPELKRLLMDTAEVVAINSKVIERTPRRAEFIKQLIALRQSSEEQAATRRRSNWAIAISVVTLLVTVAKLWQESSGSKSSVQPTTAPTQQVVTNTVTH